mgnify:CR=1 FL=1
MNQYPLWKYLLILATLLAGLIYTLPNFFGESPAVQVSPLRTSLKADVALLASVENILKTASLDVEVISLDGNSVKARFADTDIQLKAKDILSSKLGEDYVVALNLRGERLARRAAPAWTDGRAEVTSRPRIARCSPTCSAT